MKSDGSLEIRQAFYAAIKEQKMTLSQTIKQMRKIVGMTQVEYAKWVGVAPRIVIDIERNIANPTLSSLQKIAKPFGLKLGFVKFMQ